MKFWIKILCAVFLIAGLAACVKSNRDYGRHISSIELKDKVRIPEGYARVFMQNGKPSAGANLFQHYCEIEVNDLSDGNHYLKPDTFKVLNISHGITGNELTGFPAGLFGCADNTYYETYFELSSHKRQKIRKMVCREGFDGCSGHFADTGQIRKTLGKYFIVK